MDTAIEYIAVTSENTRKDYAHHFQLAVNRAKFVNQIIILPDSGARLSNSLVNELGPADSELKVMGTVRSGVLGRHGVVFRLNSFKKTAVEFGAGLVKDQLRLFEDSLDNHTVDDADNN